MKILLLCLLASTVLSQPLWTTDFEKARQDAAKEHKLILVNFSGSDWCVPCIRLHKEIFESDTFLKFAEDSLILVNADFPRLKKNQLSKEQTRQNELLADKYNNRGVFPLTVLVDQDGKTLKSWEGYPAINPQQFVNEINTSVNDGH